MLLSVQRSQNPVFDPLRKRVGPLIHCLIGDADCISGGGNGAPEQFNGLCFVHAALNHSSVPDGNHGSALGVHDSTMVAPTLDTYADRLRDAMGDLSVQALADAMDISYQAVKKVLDGGSNTFAIRNHYKAADILKISDRWLGLGEGTKHRGVEMNGWPLPPHLLAALQKADTTTLQMAETVLMGVLGIKVAPVPETTDLPA